MKTKRTLALLLVFLLIFGNVLSFAGEAVVDEEVFEEVTPDSEPPEELTKEVDEEDEKEGALELDQELEEVPPQEEPIEESKPETEQPLKKVKLTVSWKLEQGSQVSLLREDEAYELDADGILNFQDYVNDSLVDREIHKVKHIGFILNNEARFHPDERSLRLTDYSSQSEINLIILYHPEAIQELEIEEDSPKEEKEEVESPTELLEDTKVEEKQHEVAEVLEKNTEVNSQDHPAEEDTSKAVVTVETLSAEKQMQALKSTTEELKGLSPMGVYRAGTENVTKTEINPSGSWAFYHVWDKTQDPITGITSTMGYFTLSDGTIAFCMNPGLEGPEGDLTASVFSDSAFRRIAEGIATVGVASGGLSGYSFEENFAFSQMYIWKSIPFDGGTGNRYALDWRYQHSPYETHVETTEKYNAWKDEVDTRINALGKVSFDGQTINLKVGEEYRLQDQNGQLSKFNIYGKIDGLNVHKDGNTLVLNASKPISSKALTFLYSRNEVVPSITFLLDRPSEAYQDLGVFSDPYRATLNLNAENPTSHIRILKKGEGGEAVPGTVFELSRNKDFSGEVYTVTTETDGSARSEDWKTANGTTVYVREKSVPEPYALDQTVKEVTLVAGQTIEISFTNQLKPAHIRILKKGEGGEAVPGTVFELSRNKDFSGEVYTVTTGTDGSVRSEGWKTANGTRVYVREKSVPKEYILDTETIKEVALVAGQTHEVTFINKLKPGTARIRKIDSSSGESVYGATLELVDPETEKVHVDSDGKEAKWITSPENKDGVEIKDLVVGKEYIIKETKLPEGYLEPLERFSVFVTQGDDVEEFVFENEPIPTLKTTATYEDGTKENKPEIVTVVDLVKYTKLISGKEYTVKGKLVDKADETRIISEGETTFTAKEANGTIEVRFSVDASELEGTTMVVFEDLYKEDRLLATHAEITDEDQTIYIPKIRTRAGDLRDGEQDALADKSVTLVDVVSFSHLKPGVEYTLKGTLMDKATGKVLLVNGEPVTAEKAFTPTLSSGTIDLEFTFSGLSLEGKTVVVFEKLFRDQKEVAVHTDIDDVKQTVEFPDIRTKATDKVDGGKDAFAGESVTIVDVVSYSNLIVGRTYTVKGVLMDKLTGEKLLADGKEVTAETTFTAESKAGEITLEFVFNATALSGKTVVVFENLFRDQKPVATHADLSDEDQTVYIPKIGTTATSNLGEKEVDPETKTEILDKVDYQNLTPGVTYTMKGSLIDKSTKKVITTAEATFTPEEVNGTIELIFAFDASQYAGKEVVVFEDLYRGEKLIASHADLEDQGQTVKVKNPPLPSTGHSNDPIYFGGGILLLLSAIILLKKKTKVN